MLKIFSFLLKTIGYRFAFEQAKKKGLLLYLKTLQAIRKSLLFAVLLFLSLQLMLMGFIGSVVFGVWLLPLEDQNLKLWILFSFFALVFTVPFVILLIAFSEKTWLKISRADELLNGDS